MGQPLCYGALRLLPRATAPIVRSPELGGQQQGALTTASPAYWLEMALTALEFDDCSHNFLFQDLQRLLACATSATRTRLADETSRCAT